MSNKTPQIIVVGSSNTDLISYVENSPKIGETILGYKFQMGFGGKGANQAVQAAKLGAKVTMVTKLGKDIFGENTLNNYRKQNINIDYVLCTEEASTGVAPIIVDKKGNNSIVVVPGANILLTPGEVETTRTVLKSSKVLICQLEILLESTIKALKMAKEEGIFTIFNPAPGRDDLPSELYSLCDIFCPNETETEIITGKPVNTIEEAEIAAKIILDRGAKNVIITLGSRGCLLVNKLSKIHFPARKVTPVDTTGAGDSFVGSLAYFLGAGKTLEESIKNANVVASYAVQKLGTQTSFPLLSELENEAFF